MARPSDPEEVMEAALGVLILALAALASETLQMSATRILFISYFCSVIFEETNTDLPLYQARHEFVILRNRSAGLRSNSNGYFHGKSKETPLKVFQGTVARASQVEAVLLELDIDIGFSGAAALTVIP